MPTPPFSRAPLVFESLVLLALAAGGSTVVLALFAIMAPCIFGVVALTFMVVACGLWVIRRRAPARERKIIAGWCKRLECDEHRSTAAVEVRFGRAVEFARQQLEFAQREPFFPHYSPLGFAVVDNERTILTALLLTLRDDAPLVSQKQVLAAIGLGAKAYPDLVRAHLPRLRAAHPMCAARIELLLRSC